MAHLLIMLFIASVLALFIELHRANFDKKTSDCT
jgi:hypothetical protein